MSSDREREGVAKKANERSKFGLEEEGRAGDTLFHVDTYPPPPPPPFSANLQLGKAPLHLLFLPTYSDYPLPSTTTPILGLSPSQRTCCYLGGEGATIAAVLSKCDFSSVITLSHRLGESPVCVRMRSHFPFSLFLQMVVVLRTTTYYVHVSGVSREMRASFRSM